MFRTKFYNIIHFKSEKEAIQFLKKEFCQNKDAFIARKYNHLFATNMIEYKSLDVDKHLYYPLQYYEKK